MGMVIREIGRPTRHREKATTSTETAQCKQKSGPNFSYIGGWQNDLQHGRGKELYADGSIYEGPFIEGKKTGSGTMTNKDGSNYSGQFNENNIHGFGKSSHLVWPVYNSRLLHLERWQGLHWLLGIK